MPAPRTTRTTTNPTTPPDSTAPDSTAQDSTAPETAGPDVAADDPGTQDGATDPTTAPTAAGPANPAPRASTRPRRGTRSPNATTATAAASDDTVPEPGTDSAPPDTAAPDPAAAEATTDDVTPASVGDTDTGDRGDTGPVADDVWAELRKQPGCTATELARSVPASRSVVLTLLNRWCAEGSVDTTPGATTRAATRYFALPSTLPPADTTNTSTTGEPTSPAPAETTTPGETTTPQETTVPPDETAHTGTADTHDTGTPGPARTNSSGSVRLGSGALHGMVEDYLREHPDGEHGPVAVAKAVGRSSGAVANALERMVSSGWAVRTSAKPKRYRIADTSDDVPTPTPDGAASAAPSPVSGAPTAAGDTQGAAPVGPVVGGIADGGPGDDRDDGTDNAAAGTTARAGRGGRVPDGSARSGRKERATTVQG